MENYTHSEDYYLINVMVDREKSRELIDVAVALGVNPAFIVNGRGILHKKKMGFVTLPGISPSLDVLHLIVPKSHVDFVMNKLIHAGKLHHFGAGAIYSVKIHDFWFNGNAPFAAKVEKDAVSSNFHFQQDLVSITCICQRGHAEEIARGAMAAGSPGPVISFGYGHGIRDKLGFLLQLAINPKKELLEVIVGSAEADRIFEAMVANGHLDQPAQGFISTHHVEKGLINTISYQNTSPYPATMEQIIKAIDQLQGNQHWRDSGTVQTIAAKKRIMLHDLVTLNCIVKRGFGDICSLAAMEAGASGTSITYANAFPYQHVKGHALAGSDEREILVLTVGPQQIRTVVKAIATVPELEGSQVLFYTFPTPQALTYLKGAADDDEEVPEATPEEQLVAGEAPSP